MQVTTKLNTTPNGAATVTGRYVFDFARPTLEGSEKQVAWAAEIREKAERDIMESLIDAGNRMSKTEISEMFFSDDSAIDAKIAQIGEWLAMQDKGIVLGDIIEDVVSNTDARFWIDNRNVKFSLSYCIRNRTR